jgi:hypothetical protein
MVIEDAGTGEIAEGAILSDGNCTDKINGICKF